MRTHYYILTGILAYFVFLIINIPASPVIALFGDSLPVTITNISGTLWSGRAGSVVTRQNVSLDNVEWSFLPWHLLVASAAVDVTARVHDRPATARLSTGLGGDIDIDDLNLKIDAANVGPMIRMPIGELSGEIHLQVNSASLKQGEVPRIDGTVDWRQAAVTVAETAELGNVSIVINENEASPLAASISNKGGQLSLNGNLTTTAQGDYSLQLNMKPNNNASDNLTSSLEMFSRKQRNGEFVLNNKGNLKQLGLM